MENTDTGGFTRYQIFIIAILAILQFTIILDFMVLSPLGAILMKTLKITPGQFGLVVSAYALSAGASGLLASGFADRYDRKKFLLFFYIGFVLGTLVCGIAPNYEVLLIGRIITGLFGGVVGSVGFAIITDLFALQLRGRVMGFVQMALSGSQVLGIPVGLWLANVYGWHSPFIMIVGLSIVIGMVILLYMKPVTAHLLLQSGIQPFRHLYITLSRPEYLRAFAATGLLATGGFMMMPFGSAFSVNNLGISMGELPLLYMVTGICSMIISPLTGRLSDQKGKYPVFFAGTVLTAVMTLIYCNLGITPLWMVMIINVLFFTGIASRMISSSALTSAIPQPNDRGAFMGINASIQQVSGGIAAMVAGLVVVETPSGMLKNYDVLGYIVIATMLVTLVLMYSLDKYIRNKANVVRDSALTA